MDVRFIGAKRFTTNTIDSHKVIYSLDNNSQPQEITLQDGTKATMASFGEKWFEMNATPEGYEALRSATPGEMISLTLTPNPKKPDTNLCSGYTE